MVKRALRLLALAGVLSFALPASAQLNVVASDTDLAATTARGRLLYEYDQAAWHASDAVMALHPPKERLGRNIAQKGDSGWVVAFGRLNESRDKFLISVLATQGPSPQEFSAKVLETPREDAGFFFVAAKAIDLAVAAFHGANISYNAAVLPAAAGQLYVYLLPAQVKADEYLLGADVRFLVTSDGSAIVETRPMHKSLINNHGPIPPGAKIVAGNHSHVLSDVPEDSDVFYVLTRKPPMSEYIGTQSAIYEVKPDGSIRLVQKMKKH